MDLTTHYLGLDLEHPIVVGASPLSHEASGVRSLEDAGAAAIVLGSLYEERVPAEDIAALRRPKDIPPEALPLEPRDTGPDEYLRIIEDAKASASIPVIASLNGTTQAGWVDLARRIESAGADAIELNIYEMALRPEEESAEVERQTCLLVRSVCDALQIPVAVKITPFYTALPHFARELRSAGADALVLFNRFFQADFDCDSLELIHTPRLSDPSELLLRLSWTANLYGRVDCPLAVTGGVQETQDVVKSILAGAQVVQVVSTVLRSGTKRIGELRRGLADWGNAHGYERLEDARGLMSLEGCKDPKSYERRRYLQVLQSW